MELLLILLAIVLAGVAIAKVLKAKELVDGLKDPNADPISSSEIKTNALGWLVFGIVLFVVAFVQMIVFDKYMLPSAASVHGESVDELMKITMILIMSVFFITQGLLFWFGFKYYFKPGKKAFWFPHDNRLEMAWTIVPATVLILLITYGMSTWDTIMNPEEEPDLRVEIVSEQFSWATRFAGADSTLGEASFALFNHNSLGLVTAKTVDENIVATNDKIKKLGVKISNLDSLVNAGWNKGKALDEAEQSLKNQKANLIRLEFFKKDIVANPAKYVAGKDDKVVMDKTIYLPKGKSVEFQFRSKDVIHSAYFPHFRAQMNTVPGMKTNFTFTPKETSEEFNQKAIDEGKVYLEVIKDEITGEVISSKEKLGSTGYILVCNKVCGTSHFNMFLNIVVVEQDEFDSWLAEQKTFE